MIKVLLTSFLFLGLSSAVNANSAKPYQIIEPVAAKDKMPCWASSSTFKNYTQVVGYSSLGHVFMRSVDTDEYIVLHPFKKGAKNYGEFQSVEDFEEQILAEPSFGAFVLNSEHVTNIKERLGPLTKEQVYIPAPYPFLGGDESIDSYSKGDIWVMLSIVGQFHGICA